MPPLSLQKKDRNSVLKAGKTIEILSVSAKLFNKGILSMAHENCSINLIYKLSVETSLGNDTVFDIRYRLGEALSKKLIKSGAWNIDMICPVPNTGKAYAKGLADASGIRYSEVLKKIENIRTFHMEDLDLRKSLIERLICTTDENLSGKNICLVDEAIFTGTTVKILCEALREKKVGSISVLIPTPPCVGGCGHHAISAEKMLLAGTDIENARKLLGADRLIFQDKKTFDVIVAHTSMNCTECFREDL